MPLTGFEPAISAIERQQTYALDVTANGIGNPRYLQTRYENLSPLEPLKYSVIIQNPAWRRFIKTTVWYFGLSNTISA